MSDAGKAEAEPPKGSDIASLNRRIDDIVAFQKRKAPWYRDTSIVISLAAFFISLVTTVYSWYRTHQQDISALQSQLRAAIEKTGALGLQQAELDAKYKDDNPTRLRINTTINGQNIFQAHAAYSLAKVLGNSASALDLVGAANTLI